LADVVHEIDVSPMRVASGRGEGGGSVAFGAWLASLQNTENEAKFAASIEHPKAGEGFLLKRGLHPLTPLSQPGDLPPHFSFIYIGSLLRASVCPPPHF